MRASVFEHDIQVRSFKHVSVGVNLILPDFATFICFSNFCHFGLTPNTETVFGHSNIRCNIDCLKKTDTYIKKGILMYKFSWEWSNKPKLTDKRHYSYRYQRITKTFTPTNILKPFHPHLTESDIFLNICAFKIKLIEIQSFWSFLLMWFFPLFSCFDLY